MLAPAAQSLLVLAAVVAASVASRRLHPGILALAAVAALGAEPGAHFPTRLFITLVAVTLLFAMAGENGALAVMVERLGRLGGRKPRLVPLLLFGTAALVSLLGAGNVAATALVAPVGLALGRTVGLDARLTALLVVGGSNAAALSPLAATGILARGLWEPLATLFGRDAVAAWPWQACGVVFIVIAASHGAGFLLLGGARWWRTPHAEAALSPVQTPVSRPQRAMLTLLGVFAVAVAGFGLEPGAVALVLVSLGMLLGLASGERSLAKVPWSTLLLIAGLFALIGVAEARGGTQLLARALGRAASPFGRTIALAAVAAALSVVSSSSGVVLPLLIPFIPALAGGDARLAFVQLGVVLTASHLVDCSPLSSLGGLCLAALPPSDEAERLRLYRQLLAWGAIMIPVAVAVAALLVLPWA